MTIPVDRNATRSFTRASFQMMLMSANSRSRQLRAGLRHRTNGNRSPTDMRSLNRVFFQADDMAEHIERGRGGLAIQGLRIQGMTHMLYQLKS